jgi:putative membrane protein
VNDTDVEQKSWESQGIAIGLVSALALGALLYILYGHKPPVGDSGRLLFLPALNAACNAVTTFFILLGLYQIHRGYEREHRRSMLSAFASSSLFLIGYITYHFVHGDTHFPGQGWVRPVYFSILISHIVLSAVALPLVLATFYLALSGRYETHKKFARVTYPIWLYVSVTGVVIFFILRAYA